MCHMVKTENRLIIGNWKMNPASLKDAERLFKDIAKSLPPLRKTKVIICAPFFYIDKLKKISKRIVLGGQNVFGADAGPYTGEVSPRMLYDAGARYVIAGHSERRARGEHSEDINKKIKFALAEGITPVLCVGETVRDEEHGYFNIVKTQLEECLTGIPKSSISKIVIAYEPVWAISTTINHKDAIPADSLEMIIFIRKILSDKFSIDSSGVKVIYGGSVNEKDAIDFLKHGGVDGLLPGRASLNARKFLQIIKLSESI